MGAVLVLGCESTPGEDSSPRVVEGVDVADPEPRTEPACDPTDRLVVPGAQQDRMDRRIGGALRALLANDGTLDVGPLRLWRQQVSWSRQCTVSARISRDPVELEAIADLPGSFASEQLADALTRRGMSREAAEAAISGSLREGFETASRDGIGAVGWLGVIVSPREQIYWTRDGAAVASFSVRLLPEISRCWEESEPELPSEVVDAILARHMERCPKPEQVRELLSALPAVVRNPERPEPPPRPETPAVVAQLFGAGVDLLPRDAFEIQNAIQGRHTRESCDADARCMHVGEPEGIVAASLFLTHMYGAMSVSVTDEERAACDESDPPREGIRLVNRRSPACGVLRSAFTLSANDWLRTMLHLHRLHDGVGTDGALYISR